MKNYLLIDIFYIAIFSSLSFVYSKNAIHMFQQQHYELKRYGKWLFNKNNIHFSPNLIYILVQILLSFLFDSNELYLYGLFISLFITIVFSIYIIFKESNKKYIKDLVITNRVKRQIIVFALLLVNFIKAFGDGGNLFMLGIMSIFVPYILIYPMAFITMPIEYFIKKGYENDARGILNKYDNLIKIGVTGSYGKTSTKNIINDIISSNYFSLITPASYNTPMGITRTIREYLKPIHQAFVCEMGADKVGEIGYLMDFVKPRYGVVTSIGPQHLATFRNIDNIVREKMLEIEKLPYDGVGFINVDNEYIRNYSIRNSCKIVRVGIDCKDADYVANNVKYSKNGTSFSVKINKKAYKFKTKLLGHHNITNILIGIAVGIELGIPVKQIVENVSNIEQIEHRLQCRKINDFNFIDDAFNSNPVGSKMAIDVLSMMSGKRVVVTPGMIDLGNKQDEYNYEFGRYMLDKVDYVLLVGEKQTKKIYQALSDNKFNMNKVIVFSDIGNAMNYIFSNFSNRDTILLENDLPDAFNV